MHVERAHTLKYDPTLKLTHDKLERSQQQSLLGMYSKASKVAAKVAAKVAVSCPS
jgi:hypothetical protein